MITIKQVIKMSAAFSKLGIEKISNPEASSAEVGATLMLQIANNFHKAENEIYELIAEIKGVTSKEAENIDAVEFIKEILADEGIKAFFRQAVKRV